MPRTRTENLALDLQEVLTAVVRLRVNRQSVSDAETFRHHMREHLRAAATAAQRSGYSHEDAKLAAFATVALLDESILNSQNPLFADWPRKTLQEEMFGIHVAGETFFQYVQQLLQRNDSEEVADVLEVYHLCLLLGYRGRYSLGGRGELQGTIDAIAAKIRRIRGVFQGLSPEWALPPDTARITGADPWVRKLVWVAVGCAAMALVLFLIFKLTLSSGASDLRLLTWMRPGATAQGIARRVHRFRSSVTYSGQTLSYSRGSVSVGGGPEDRAATVRERLPIRCTSEKACLDRPGGLSYSTAHGVEG